MTDYPQVSIENAAKEVVRLHEGIEGKMRTSVQDAIRIGEILTQVRIKKDKDKEDWLPWVKELPFSQPTAWNYMKVYEYRSKLSSLDNLHDAYKQVTEYQSQEKASEQKKAFQRVIEFKKTGKKPEGWRRETDDKIYKEDIARDERLKKVVEKCEQVKKNIEKKQVDDKNYREQRAKETQATLDSLERLKILEDQKIEFIQKIRLSGNNANDVFNDMLILYIEGMATDTEKLEACHNLIKICKGIANGLQKKSIKA